MKFFRRLLFALGFLVLWTGLAGAAPSPAEKSDEQIIAKFQKESARIQQELHAAREDIARVTALQKEMQTLLSDAMAKLSPTSRATLEVGMKVINPLMEDAIAYSGALQKYMDAGGFDYTSGTSAEIIDRRLAQLGEIERLNEGLIKRTMSIDTDIEAVLKASKLKAAEKAGFLKGFHASTGGRLGAIRAVRTLDARLYVEVRGVYGHLREQLGKWSVKDGELAFDDAAQVAIYNARLQRVTVIVERQEIAQRKALGID